MSNPFTTLALALALALPLTAAPDCAPRTPQRPGLGPAKTGQLRAAMELARQAQRSAECPRITSSRTAGAHLLPRCQGWTEERFGLLALNVKGDLLAERILSQGNVTVTLISPREFFREALRYGATMALAFHNHPSGDPAPNREDTQVTRRLQAAGESLCVPLADHLILGRDGYHSFRAAEGWDQRGRNG